MEAPSGGGGSRSRGNASVDFGNGAPPPFDTNDPCIAFLFMSCGILLVVLRNMEPLCKLTELCFSLLDALPSMYRVYPCRLVLFSWLWSVHDPVANRIIDAPVSTVACDRLPSPPPITYRFMSMTLFWEARLTLVTYLSLRRVVRPCVALCEEPRQSPPTCELLRDSSVKETRRWSTLSLCSL